MNHLEREGIVHRDLAARNILVINYLFYLLLIFPPSSTNHVAFFLVIVSLSSQQLTSTFTPKISDFGLSRMIGGTESSSTQSNVGPLKWYINEQ